jgi:hypothetical protein
LVEAGAHYVLKKEENEKGLKGPKKKARLWRTLIRVRGGGVFYHAAEHLFLQRRESQAFCFSKKKKQTKQKQQKG